MNSKPPAERRKSDNGNGNSTSPYLSPDAAQAQTSRRNSTSSHSNRLLPSPIPPQTASSIGSHRPQSRISAISRNSRDESIGATGRKSHSHSVSSTPRTLASSNRSLDAENKDRSRAVRTLPIWVQSADDDDDNIDAASHLLPRTPVSARPASHHYMPTPKSTVPGRKFDHAREGAPVTLSTHVSDSAYRWKAFAQSSNYEHAELPTSSRGQVVDDAWMTDNMPDLEQEWEPIDGDDKEEKLKGFWLFSPTKRKRKIMRFHKTVMNHPMVPAVIRMVVLTFSVVALSLQAQSFTNRTAQVAIIIRRHGWPLLLMSWLSAIPFISPMMNTHQNRSAFVLTTRRCH